MWALLAGQRQQLILSLLLKTSATTHPHSLRSFGGFFPELCLFHVRLQFNCCPRACPVSSVDRSFARDVGLQTLPAEKREDWPGARRRRLRRSSGNSFSFTAIVLQKILALLTSRCWSPIHRPSTARILLCNSSCVGKPVFCFVCSFVCVLACVRACVGACVRVCVCFCLPCLILTPCLPIVFLSFL